MGKTIEFTESILRSLRQPVLILDTDLRAVMANPAFYETLEVPPEQLEGKRIQDLISDEDGQPHLRRILQTVVDNPGRLTDVEVSCKLPKGESRVLSVSALSAPFESDEPEMILVELRDITEARDADQRIKTLNAILLGHTTDLETANRELESFSHSVSHDLKTPLRFTNKIAHQLLQEHGEELTPGAVHKVQMILESTHEMAGLIADLLNFSKVSREPMKKRHVDMKRLVRETIEEVQDSENGREIEIEVGDLAPCRADRALLKQVIVNLLSNALKFTRPRNPSRIHVGCTEREGEVVYFVRDNGVGFEPESSKNLFLAFQRLHRSNDFEGTGIGLALARRIVDRHEGRIWAQSEVDKGATFFFTLGGQKQDDKEPS